MNRTACIAVAALAAFAVQPGASARPAQTIMVRNVVVRYGDLNLATAQGEAALRERIASAAKQACGGSPLFSTHYRDEPRYVTREFEKCTADAAGQAAAEIRARYASR